MVKAMLNILLSHINLGKNRNYMTGKKHPHPEP